MHKVLSDKKTIALMVIPGMILVVGVIFIPILMAAYYGCTNYSGLAGSYKMVGLENFIHILTNDKEFWTCLWNALTQAFFRVLFLDTFCIIVAIIIDYISGRSERFFRVLFFVPCTISVVVTAKLWVQIYNPTYGLLNKLLSMMGLSGLTENWLTNPGTALGSVHFMIIWCSFGWTFLYYYAGVKNISGDLYEAALIDGCGRLRMYWKITVPLLKPVMAVCITLDVIASLKQMEIIMLSTNGGPGSSTMFLANYIYQLAFDNNRYGYGNAVSVLFVFVCIGVTVLLKKILPKGD